MGAGAARAAIDASDEAGVRKILDVLADGGAGGFDIVKQIFGAGALDAGDALEDLVAGGSECYGLEGRRLLLGGGEVDVQLG